MAAVKGIPSASGEKNPLRTVLFILSIALSAFCVYNVLDFQSSSDAQLSGDLIIGQVNTANYASEGAPITSFFFEHFGVLSYLFSFAIIYLGYFLFFKPLDIWRANFYKGALRILGFNFVTIGLAGLLSRFSDIGYTGAGGLLGDMLNMFADVCLPNVLTVLLFGLFVICGLPLLVAQSPFFVFDYVGDLFFKIIPAKSSQTKKQAKASQEPDFEADPALAASAAALSPMSDVEANETDNLDAQGYQDGEYGADGYVQDGFEGEGYEQDMAQADSQYEQGYEVNAADNEPLAPLSPLNNQSLPPLDQALNQDDFDATSQAQDNRGDVDQLGNLVSEGIQGGIEPTFGLDGLVQNNNEQTQAFEQNADAQEQDAASYEQTDDQVLPPLNNFAEDEQENNNFYQEPRGLEDVAAQNYEQDDAQSAAYAQDEAYDEAASDEKIQEQAQEHVDDVYASEPQLVSESAEQDLVSDDQGAQDFINEQMNKMDEVESQQDPSLSAARDQVLGLDQSFAAAQDQKAALDAMANDAALAAQAAQGVEPMPINNAASEEESVPPMPSFGRNSLAQENQPLSAASSYQQASFSDAVAPAASFGEHAAHNAVLNAAQAAMKAAAAVADPAAVAAATAASAAAAAKEAALKESAKAKSSLKAEDAAVAADSASTAKEVAANQDSSDSVDAKQEPEEHTKVVRTEVEVEAKAETPKADYADPTYGAYVDEKTGEIKVDRDAISAKLAGVKSIGDPYALANARMFARNHPEEMAQAEEAARKALEIKLNGGEVAEQNEEDETVNAMAEDSANASVAANEASAEQAKSDEPDSPYGYGTYAAKLAAQSGHDAKDDSASDAADVKSKDSSYEAESLDAESAADEAVESDKALAGEQAQDDKAVESDDPSAVHTIVQRTDPKIFAAQLEQQRKEREEKERLEREAEEAKLKAEQEKLEAQKREEEEREAAEKAKREAQEQAALEAQKAQEEQEAQEEAPLYVGTYAEKLARQREAEAKAKGISAESGDDNSAADNYISPGKNSKKDKSAAKDEVVKEGADSAENEGEDSGATSTIIRDTRKEFEAAKAAKAAAELAAKEAQEQALKEEQERLEREAQEKAEAEALAKAQESERLEREAQEAKLKAEQEAKDKDESEALAKESEGPSTFIYRASPKDESKKEEDSTSGAAVAGAALMEELSSLASEMEDVSAQVEGQEHTLVAQQDQASDLVQALNAAGSGTASSTSAARSSFNFTSLHEAHNNEDEEQQLRSTLASREEPSSEETHSIISKNDGEDAVKSEDESSSVEADDDFYKFAVTRDNESFTSLKTVSVNMFSDDEQNDDASSHDYQPKHAYDFGSGKQAGQLDESLSGVGAQDEDHDDEFVTGATITPNKPTLRTSGFNFAQFSNDNSAANSTEADNSANSSTQENSSDEDDDNIISFGANKEEPKRSFEVWALTSAFIPLPGEDNLQPAKHRLSDDDYGLGNSIFDRNGFENKSNEASLSAAESHAAAVESALDYAQQNAAQDDTSDEYDNDEYEDEVDESADDESFDEEQESSDNAANNHVQAGFAPNFNQGNNASNAMLNPMMGQNMYQNMPNGQQVQYVQLPNGQVVPMMANSMVYPNQQMPMGMPNMNQFMQMPNGQMMPMMGNNMMPNMGMMANQMGTQMGNPMMGMANNPNMMYQNQMAMMQNMGNQAMANMMGMNNVANNQQDEQDSYDSDEEGYDEDDSSEDTQELAQDEQAPVEPSVHASFNMPQESVASAPVAAAQASSAPVATPAQAAPDMANQTVGMPSAGNAFMGAHNSSSSNMPSYMAGVPQAQAQQISFDDNQSKALCTVPRHHYDNWRPSLDLLARSNSHVEISNEDLEKTAQRINEVLHSFGVKATVADYLTGPVITRFDLDLAPGVKSSAISSIETELCRNLLVPNVRVVPIIDGSSYVGLEVPNPQRQFITLADMASSRDFQESKAVLPMCLGASVVGAPVVKDLADSPHLLVAGTTGSGKSAGLNTMLISMLLKRSPAELRLILVDPKQLEFSIYKDLPHLITPVITDVADKTPIALNWCVDEMERRFKLMSLLGVRKLAEYNDLVKESNEAGRPVFDPLWSAEMGGRPQALKPLPWIVVVVEEFADLMAQSGRKKDKDGTPESLIARLSAKSRAAGIHLVLVTQTPRSEVVTGMIKANFPSRVAFTVQNRIDSTIVLDEKGAECLLGNGDMLYKFTGSGTATRAHGAFTSNDDVKAVVDAWRDYSGAPEYLEDVIAVPVEETEELPEDKQQQLDLKFDQAVEVARAYMNARNKPPTVTDLQTELGVGYPRAKKLYMQLTREGIIEQLSY